MLRRSLFACALMLAGVVGFGSSAKAVPTPSTGTVEFQGNVDPSCTLTNPKLGNLVLSGSSALSSSAGGTAAQIDITCTGTATLSIADPAPVGTNPTTTTTNSATIKLGSKTANSASSTGGATTASIDSTDNGTASVDMLASAASALAVGTYDYTVLVTATP